jgi:hypothetical protein
MMYWKKSHKTNLLACRKEVLFGLFITFMSLTAVADGGSNRDKLANWAFDRISMWSPPGKSAYKEDYESAESGSIRYRSVIEDAISVVYDPNESPVFQGPIGRAKTLALVLAIADSESGFRRTVDSGEVRGDKGNSWCLMQIWVGQDKSKTRSEFNIDIESKFWKRAPKGFGYGGEDMVADRKVCFRVALHMIRRSFASCYNNPVSERLAIYASGQGCDVGKDASKNRVGKAINWLARKAPPVTDQQVME